MRTETDTPLLSARGLTLVLTGEDGDSRVLDGVDFELQAGEVVDVVGPSGSGKTSLLRALCRLMPGATGELAVGGRSAATVSAAEWRTLVALLPQKPAILVGTVRDNLVLPFTLKVREGSGLPSDERLRHGLDELGLHDIALDRDGARLSVGQQARVALLRVVLTEPAALLLDEADAALDEDSAAALRSVAARFADGGGGVIRVRHRADDGLASRRLRLAGGHLAEVAR